MGAAIDQIRFEQGNALREHKIIQLKAGEQEVELARIRARFAEVYDRINQVDEGLHDRLEELRRGLSEVKQSVDALASLTSKKEDAAKSSGGSR